MRLLLALIGMGYAMVGVVACAGGNHHDDTNHLGQRALIGKTKQELFACAGPPVSEKVTPDRTVAVYYREASQLEESFPGSKGSFAMVHHGCRATIVVREDRVEGVRYDSEPSSYRDEDHCEEIFAGCLPLTPVKEMP
ncbi:hypothetical protein [Petrachloros mirabilis]